VADDELEPGEPEVVAVQDFRAQLKAQLEKQRGLLVGNYWHTRAIVIPVPRGPHYSDKDKAARRATMRAWFASCLEKMESRY
jgi:hypothetical protein